MTNLGNVRPYYCYFCQFRWGERYEDKTPREPNEASGLYCPKCHVKQKDVLPEEERLMKLRKYTYGKIKMLNDERLAFEEFILNL